MLDFFVCVFVFYCYGVYCDGQCICCESGIMVYLFCFGKKKNCYYILNDFWKDFLVEFYLYSFVFSGDYQFEIIIKVIVSVDGSIIFWVLCFCLYYKC